MIRLVRWAAVACACTMAWGASPAAAARKSKSKSRPAENLSTATLREAESLKPLDIPVDVPTTDSLQLPLRSELEQMAEKYQARLKTATGAKSQASLQTAIAKVNERIAAGPNLNLLANQIMKQVGEIRELSPRRSVASAVLDKRQMREYLNAKLDEEMPAGYLQALELLYTRLGALQPGTDLKKAYIRLLQEQAAGIYDPKTKKFYVTNGFNLDKPISRIVLAHELCHALQDQYFDLDKMVATRHNSDQELAAASIVEGDATVLMGQYALEHLRSAKMTDYAEILTQDQSALRSAPNYLRRTLIFPYLQGQEFLLAGGGISASVRNKAFASVPESTEQIIHPKKYWDTPQDHPTSVSIMADPGNSWKFIGEDTGGEFFVQVLFDTWRKTSLGIEVGNGWDGDRMKLWTLADAKGTTVSASTQPWLLLWVSTWDSPDAAQRFANSTADLWTQGPYADKFSKRPITRSDKTLKVASDTTGTLGLYGLVHQNRAVLGLSTSPDGLHWIESAAEGVLRSVPNGSER